MAGKFPPFFCQRWRCQPREWIFFSGSFFCNHFIYIFLCHQEQLRHKVKFNLVKFDSRVQAWRDRLVDCNTHVCISIWTIWLVLKWIHELDSRIWTANWNSFSANIMIVAVMSASNLYWRKKPADKQTKQTEHTRLYSTLLLSGRTKLFCMIDSGPYTTWGLSYSFLYSAAIGLTHVTPAFLSHHLINIWLNLICYLSN